MQDDSLEVWCVEYRKGKKHIGWLDDEEQKITKNKSHITFLQMKKQLHKLLLNSIT